MQTFKTTQAEMKISCCTKETTKKLQTKILHATASGTGQLE